MRRHHPKAEGPSDEDLLKKYGEFAEEYAAVRQESSALAGKEEESAKWEARKIKLAKDAIERKASED